MNSLTYIMVPTADIEQIDFGCVKQDKANVRYNLTGDMFIVKYGGSQPPCLSSYQTYNHSEIRAHINDPLNGWTLDLQ